MVRALLLSKSLQLVHIKVKHDVGGTIGASKVENLTKEESKHKGSAEESRNSAEASA